MPAKVSSRTKKTEVKRPPKTRKEQALLSIDFPAEGEDVMPGHYAVRLTSTAAGDVDLKIGESDWLPCRPALGYFWFDWYPFKAGEHRLTARLRPAKGRAKALVTRTCTVSGSSAN